MRLNRSKIIKFARIQYFIKDTLFFFFFKPPLLLLPVKIFKYRFINDQT